MIYMHTYLSLSICIYIYIYIRQRLICPSRGTASPASGAARPAPPLAELAAAPPLNSHSSPAPRMTWSCGRATTRRTSSKEEKPTMALRCPRLLSRTRTSRPPRGPKCSCSRSWVRPCGTGLMQTVKGGREGSFRMVG